MGRVSDGPRTTGDINILGLSLTLYQVWLYLAVFNAPYLFNSFNDGRDGAAAGFGIFPALTLPSALILSFLAVSAICLCITAALSRKAQPLMQSKLPTAIATLFCIAGTACTALDQGTSGAMPIVAGALIGLGSPLFLIRWGCVYARFRFATAVINTGFSLALSMIAAIAIVNWMPAPISGIIALALPLSFLLVFWDRNDTSSDASGSSMSPSNMIGYYVRLGACLAVLGVVLGAMRTLCISDLLSANGVTTELVLVAGCITGAIVFVVALSLSQKESRWDWLFRVATPIVALGCACMPLMIGGSVFASEFVFSLGYVCLGVLLWVLLANLSSEINGTFIFGMGTGVLNLASIVGVALTLSLPDVNAAASASGIPPMLQTQASLAMLALALCVLTILGYSLLPRYYELKTILSSALNVMAADADVSDDLAPSSLDAALEEKTDGADVADDAPLSTDMPAQSDETPSATIESAASTSVAPKPAPSEKTQSDVRDEKGSFMRRCEEISQKYKLSGREQEVLILLAKGHNASFILEKLCISRSTAKTHINHIYKKLDIHTQQELLNMVEERRHGSVDSEHAFNNFDSVVSLGAMGAAVPQDTKVLKETILQAHIKHSTKQHH